MKVVKLTKKMLNMHPADLLVKLDAVNLEQDLTFPGEVYFSEKDYKTLRANLVKSAKKQLGDVTKKTIELTVNMELLNFGPNESLAKVLKPGFALVDMNKITHMNEEI